MKTGAPTPNMPRGPPLPPLRHWLDSQKRLCIFQNPLVNLKTRIFAAVSAIRTTLSWASHMCHPPKIWWNNCTHRISLHRR